MKKCFGLGRTTKMVLSFVLVLLTLGVSAFAASRNLHHLLHPDSDNAAHHCLITVFANGQLTGTDTKPVVAFFAAVVLFAVLLPEVPPRQNFDYSSAPSRAPPRF